MDTTGDYAIIVSMVCLIGTVWGRFLGKELRTFYHGPLAVCSRDRTRLRKVAAELNAGEEIMSWRRVADNPNVSHVIMAVRPDLNCEIACALMRAGKHVLVEKPVSCTLEEADEMIDTAQVAGVTLAVGENIPFRPVIQEARKRLAEIGEPRLFVGSAIHGGRYKSPGILLDVGVHYVRAVRELFGEPHTVFASQARGCAEGDDNATLVLGSRKGWQAVITLSWQASAGISPEFVITGTAGTMKVWPQSTSLDIYPWAPNRLTRAISRIRPTALRQALESPETQRRRIRLPRTDKMGYRAELKAFLAMRPGDTTSAIEARKDVAVVLAAYRSLHAGLNQAYVA